jgi:hypothetical protein
MSKLGQVEANQATAGSGQQPEQVLLCRQP